MRRYRGEGQRLRHRVPVVQSVDLVVRQGVDPVAEVMVVEAKLPQGAGRHEGLVEPPPPVRLRLPVSRDRRRLRGLLDQLSQVAADLRSARLGGDRVGRRRREADGVVGHLEVPVVQKRTFTGQAGKDPSLDGDVTPMNRRGSRGGNGNNGTRESHTQLRMKNKNAELGRKYSVLD